MLEYDGRIYTMGLLVQSNHGVLSDLTVCGRRIGPALAQRLETRKADQGSILAVLATDLPLDARQLGRVAQRISVGPVSYTHLDVYKRQVLGFVLIFLAVVCSETKFEFLRKKTLEKKG